MKKNLAKSQIVAVIVLFAVQFMFTGCAKENIFTDQEFVETRSANGCVFEDVKWEIADKNYIDEYNNVGILYLNANNKAQGLFEYEGPLFACPNATGSFASGDNKGVKWASCSGAVSNCWYGTTTHMGKEVNCIFRCL
ncbi:MAG: hypothetical protein LBQ22_00860 [Bacteroidales bacterium]|jgi:hypothetical protein|nr:hypothetical protein [Bacteroidales bacterium]